MHELLFFHGDSRLLLNTETATKSPLATGVPSHELWGDVTRYTTIKGVKTVPLISHLIGTREVTLCPSCKFG